jgi:hypothetical protein
MWILIVWCLVAVVGAPLFGHAIHRINPQD